MSLPMDELDGPFETRDDALWVAARDYEAKGQATLVDLRREGWMIFAAKPLVDLGA